MTSGLAADLFAIGVAAPCEARCSAKRRGGGPLPAGEVRVSDSRVKQRGASALTVVLLLILGVVVVAGVGVVLQARGRLDEAKRRWALEVAPLEEIAARYPDREANQAALDLDERAARLGIGQVPKDASRPQVETTLPERVALKEWLAQQLASASSVTSAPPEGVRAWLAEHEAQILSLANAVLAGEAPRWESHLKPDIAIPNLFGHLTLQRTLSAAGLEAALADRPAVAVRLVEASWRLNDELFRRPELISRLIAVAAARDTAGLLRKLPSVPAEWEERLVSLDLRALIRESLEFEAWYMSDYPRRRAENVTDEEEPREEVIDRWFGGPFFKLDMADHLDRLRQLLGSEAMAGRCPVDRRAVGALPEYHWWRDLATDGGTDLSASLVRGDRLQVDLELTRQVLRARRLRSPEKALGSCDQWSYVTEVGPDGNLRVRFEGQAPEAPQTGLVLPLEWMEDSAGASP